MTASLSPRSRVPPRRFRSERGGLVSLHGTFLSNRSPRLRVIALTALAILAFAGNSLLTRWALAPLPGSARRSVLLNS